MTTFVGYDYLVTRKNGENGGKMKMKGVGEFLGKIVSLFGAQRDVDTRTTCQKSHQSEKFQGSACAFESDLPLGNFD